MRILIKEKLSEHKSKTPEGYLICQDAILARTGDQGYLKSEIYEDFEGDDAMVQVQRKPEQVFATEALASFEDKPITIEHPDENVGPDNYSDLAVGHVRNIRKGQFNGQDVMIGDLVITDSQAIDEIENGIRTELSCGYDCDITEGDHPEQINIRGNHIALCKEGRAGIAKIIDSKPAYDVNPKQGETKSEFLSRFMKETVNEYPDQKQRFAVANSYWKKSMEDAKKNNVWTVMWAYTDDDGDPYTGTTVVYTDTEDEAAEIAKSWHPRITHISRIMKGNFGGEFADVRSGKKIPDMEDATDKEIPLKDFIKTELSPEYVYETSGAITAQFASDEDAERALGESRVKDLDHDVIEDESAYFLVFKKDDLKTYINEHKLLEDSSEEVEDKYVVYNVDGVYYFTSFENYNSRIQNARKIYKLPWAESLEEVLEYLMKHFNLKRESIITIGDSNKKSVADDVPYRSYFYKEAINELDKMADDIVDEDTDEKDENKEKIDHQRYKILKMLEEKADTYKESLKEAEVNDSFEDLSLNVKDWYTSEFSEDSVGETLDPEVTFQDVFDCLDREENLYLLLGGAADSVIRERVFDKLSELIDCDYKYIYDQWLKSRG